MNKKYTKRGYWTYEKCLEESKKYKTRVDFKNNSMSAYSKCIKSKWYDIISTLSLDRKPRFFWTKENCLLEAMKFSSRSEFAISKGYGYQAAAANGWLDEICSHMDLVGNYKRRCIYVYEFEDKHAYIGLTYNLSNRHSRRIKDKNDAVYIYLKKNVDYNLRQLTDYTEVNEAKKLEKYWVDFYRDNGWNILNRDKTGSIGGNIVKWTYEECKKESLKYDTHLSFQKNNCNCLSAIYKNGWKELLNHLKYSKLPNNSWTYEKCLEASKKCNSKTEFYRKFRGAYSSSKTNNWYDEICLIANLMDRKSPFYYEIDENLFHKIHTDRIKNKIPLDEVCKKYKVGIEKLKSKYKEMNIPIIRIDRM